MPPPGTPDEFLFTQPLGLGVRVPAFIISPWSRGGRVCSQVFDHTSILRFLETWTGVMEPNISAWRRQVCGDLTSAFDFAHPNTNNYPVLPDATWYAATPYAPVPPAVQAMPVQQTNTLLSVPVPYQPEITAQTDCAAGLVYLTMTNAGSASVHFAVYASPVQNNGPQQCDVNPGNSLTASFAAATGSGSGYDLTCYSPNGFQRRFAGSLSRDCNQIEVVSMIDTNAGNVTLALQNATASEVEFVLTDGYGLGGPWDEHRCPGSAGQQRLRRRGGQQWLVRPDGDGLQRCQLRAPLHRAHRNGRNHGNGTGPAPGGRAAAAGYANAADRATADKPPRCPEQRAQCHQFAGNDPCHTRRQFIAVLCDQFQHKPGSHLSRLGVQLHRLGQSLVVAAFLVAVECDVDQLGQLRRRGDAMPRQRHVLPFAAMI